MTPAEKTRTVYLRKGMKFNAVFPKISKKGRFRRKKYVGPCQVEMTEAQIVAFGDLLQTTPQVLATEPVEPEPVEPESETEPKESEGDEDDETKPED
jgi:hypothetical protein